MTVTKQDDLQALLAALFDSLCRRPWEYPIYLVQAPLVVSEELRRLNDRCDKLAAEVDRLQWALRTYVDYLEGEERRSLQFMRGSAEQVLKASQARMEEL